jgi:hypothetical protein
MKNARVSDSVLKLMLLCAIALFMLTFIIIRPVDVMELPDAKLYPLYYFLVQPMTVWIAVPLAVLVVVFSPRPFHRVLVVLILALLIEFLPSFMVVNPWLPDQYPYLAEAYWIYLYGKISSIQYLSIVPGLGLSYGIFEIVTDLSPFIMSKAFSFIQAIMLVIMLVPLSKKLTGDEALLPLLFLSLNYFTNIISTFHRAGLHFTYTLILLYFVFTTLSHQNLKWRCALASTIVFGAMVLTYPGSGFILTAIIGAYLLLYITRKAPPASLKLSAVVFSIIFSVWYGYVAWSELRVVGSIWSCLADVLQLELSFEESMTHPFTAGLTPLFRTLVYVRLIIEGGVIATGFLIALYKYISVIMSRFREGRDSDIPFAYMLTLASLIAPAPWLLTDWSRWSFYHFSHYFLLFSLMSFLYYIYSQRHLRRSMNLLPIKMLAIIAITSTLLLVPLLRYASLPYLSVTTPELHSTFFVHKYFAFDSNCYYLEYPPNILPGLLVRGNAFHKIYSMYWFENVTLGLYIVTNRALTRDGFYLYLLPLQVRLEELENSMIVQGVKVYDNEYNRIYYLE